MAWFESVVRSASAKANVPKSPSGVLVITSTRIIAQRWLNSANETEPHKHIEIAWFESVVRSASAQANAPPS